MNDKMKKRINKSVSMPMFVLVLLVSLLVLCSVIAGVFIVRNDDDNNREASRMKSSITSGSVAEVKEWSIKQELYNEPSQQIMIYTAVAIFVILVGVGIMLHGIALIRVSK